MSKNMTLLLVAGFLLVTTVACWGILSVAREAIGPRPDVPSSLATQVQQLIYPTPTVWVDPLTVVRQVRALARLETVQYTLEKVVTAETGQGALAPLYGDRLLFVAHGEVIGGVDLSRLSDQDVTVTPDGHVTLVMPAAEVLVYKLDNEKSYVYDRQTGLLTSGNDQLETQARQVAEQAIVDAALEDGLLRQAQDNAATFLERMLRSLGYTDVTIVTATPMP